MRGLWGLVVVLALVGAPATAAAPEAHRSGPTLTVTPSVAVAQEQLRFTGTVPGGKRKVVLQRSGRGWINVVSTRSDAKGRFVLVTPNRWARDEIAQPVASTSFRMWAPETKQGRRTLRAVGTPVRVVRNATSTVTLTMPLYAAADTPYDATAVASPARPGRAMALQRRVGSTWTNVGTGKQDASGRVTWRMRTPPGTAVQDHRVLVAAAQGAPAVVGATVRLQSREPAADQVEHVGDTCRDVVYVGARGSGQPWDASFGMGDEVRYAYDAYRAALPATVRTGFFPVPYPALDVNRPEILTSPAYQRQFFSSIDAGVDAVLDFLVKRQAACGASGERYVLAGFSQGAMVMHRATQARVALGADPAFAAVDGVIAVADGDRQGAQGGHAYGPPTDATSQGIGVAAGDLGLPGVTYRVDRAPITTTAAFGPDRFHSVCMIYDAICDYRPSVGLPMGISIHTQAYRDNATGDYAGDATPYVDDAAGAVAEETAAALVPGDLPTLDLPDAIAGRAYRAQLARPEGRPGTWALRGPRTDGLSVSTSGALSAPAGFRGGVVALAFTSASGTQHLDLPVGLADPYLMIGPCVNAGATLCKPPYTASDDLLVVAGFSDNGRRHPHRLQVRINSAEVLDTVMPGGQGGGYLGSVDGGCTTLTVVLDGVHTFTGTYVPPGASC